MSATFLVSDDNLSLRMAQDIVGQVRTTAADALDTSSQSLVYSYQCRGVVSSGHRCSHQVQAYSRSLPLDIKNAERMASATTHIQNVLHSSPVVSGPFFSRVLISLGYRFYHALAGIYHRPLNTYTHH